MKRKFRFTFRKGTQGFSSFFMNLKHSSSCGKYYKFLISIGFPIFLFLCLPFGSFSQTLKKKTVSDGFYKEIFYINKKDNVKTGPYTYLRISSGDSLAKGNFLNGERTGIWTFYSPKNDVYLKYNYDENTIVYKSDRISEIDSFLIFSGGEFRLMPIDEPPICIGYENLLRIYLARVLEVPVHISRNKKEGYALASFEINEKGELGNIKTEKSFEESFDKQIVDALNEFNENWVPAIVDGNPVASKIIVGATVYNEGTLNKFKITGKPYLLTVDLVYGNAIRSSMPLRGPSFGG